MPLSRARSSTQTKAKQISKIIGVGLSVRCIQHIFTQFVLITLPEAQLHSKSAALVSCSHYKHSFIEETRHVHRFILMQLKSLQDGTSLCHRRHPTRRQNAQTENEDGSSQPNVGLPLC